MKILRQLHEERRAVQEATRLVESLSKDDMARARALIKKIKALKGAAGENELMAKACGDALADVNDFLGGGIATFMKKVGSKVLKKITGTDELDQNAFVKASVFLNCIERGLADTFEVMEDNLEGFKKTSSKSFIDQLKGKPEASQLAGRTHKVLTKAFSPDTFFSRVASLMGGKGVVPYVKDVNALTASFLKMSTFDLAKLVQVAQESQVSKQASEFVKDVYQTVKDTTQASDTVRDDDFVTVLSKKLGIEGDEKMKSTLVSRIADEADVSKDVVDTVLSVLQKTKGVVTVETRLLEDTSDAVAKTLKSSDKALKIMAKKMGLDPDVISKLAELDDDKFEQFVDQVVSRYPQAAQKLASAGSPSQPADELGKLIKMIADKRNLPSKDVSSTMNTLMKHGVKIKV